MKKRKKKEEKGRKREEKRRMLFLNGHCRCLLSTAIQAHPASSPCKTWSTDRKNDTQFSSSCNAETVALMA